MEEQMEENKTPSLKLEGPQAVSFGSYSRQKGEICVNASIWRIYMSIM